MDRIDTLRKKELTIKVSYSRITDRAAMEQLQKLLEDMSDCAWHNGSDAFRHLVNGEDKIVGYIEIKAKTGERK